MRLGETPSIVFACVFGSAMFGLLIGKVLPDRHLDNSSKDIIKLSTGMIVMLAALVLGLMVSSAKGKFDQANNEMMQASVKTVVLDRTLAQYGAEAKEIRAMLKSGLSTAAELMLTGDESKLATLDTPEGVARLENVQAGIRALSPQNDSQRWLQSRALQLSAEMANARWLLVMQRKGSISIPMLAVMVFWLSMIFMAWGVLAPRNPVVAVTLLLAALSVSGATLLILELDEPLSGLIRISPVPMREAIAHLGE